VELEAGAGAAEAPTRASRAARTSSAPRCCGDMVSLGGQS
jgi:hypothetical protein